MSTSSSNSQTSGSSCMVPKKDIILESYLVKTGPLNKALPLSWRQRWFVFSKNGEVLDLSYYTDESKLKKKGSVDLTKFVSIKPSVTVGGRDNLFALEIQGRTYIMQAANSSSKNVWLAKLYEALSGERVFHAAVPQQTQLQADETLLRAVSKTELVIVNPTTGQTLCNIDYTTVRRHGSCNLILWFEICPCSASELKLYYWTITAGSSGCAQLARDIKLFIEQRNQKHMVAENIPEGQIFTSQCHFTCPVPVTAQTSGLPNQIRVMCKLKRRPTDLQRKGSEHSLANTSLNLLNSPPPHSPHALGPNSRQDSVDSVFANSPDSSNTLATFRERQFSFAAADTPHSGSSFEHSRSLANFRQNSTESSATGIVSPIIEEKVLVKMGSNLSLTTRSESPYPPVARDSGVGSDGDLSPSNPRKQLEQMNSISSVGSASSNHSAHSGDSDERQGDDTSRQPPAAPPRSEISLRMYASQRVAQPAN